MSKPSEIHENCCRCGDERALNHRLAAARFTTEAIGQYRMRIRYGGRELFEGTARDVEGWLVTPTAQEVEKQRRVMQDVDAILEFPPRVYSDAEVVDTLIKPGAFVGGNMLLEQRGVLSSPDT